MTVLLPRRPMEATTLAEVAQYYETRARQMWHEGWRWNRVLEDRGAGYRTEFKRNGQRFASFYVMAQNHGQGHFRKWVGEEPLPIVTVTDCHIEQVLEHIGARYERVADILDSAEYRLIEASYGDERARRSGVFLMNHIDEGLAVLTAIGASEHAMRAFCLHPLVQDDAALARNFDALSEALASVPGGTRTLALAMEYRNVANAYLARVPMPAGGIRLSPLAEVNDMLVADKVQNRKDFERYHAQTHENRIRLAEYFSQWCEALGVAERYAELKAMLPDF